MTTRTGPELSQGSIRIAQIKTNVGSCYGRGGGHGRSSKWHSGRQHKTIGVAGITAGQGNDVGRRYDGEQDKGRSEGTA